MTLILCGVEDCPLRCWPGPHSRGAMRSRVAEAFHGAEVQEYGWGGFFPSLIILSMARLFLQTVSGVDNL